MKPAIRSSLFSELLQQHLQTAKLITVLLLLAISPASFAEVQFVTASPVSISAKGSATININWRVTRLETPAPLPPVMVSSSSAVLEINGTAVATVGGLVSTTSSFTIGSSGTVSLNDRLTINAALARRIAESPAGSVRIVRTFNDQQPGGGPADITGFAQLSPGSGNSGPLTVRRIELSFENNARTDVVYKNESIRAIVDLSFRSSGILKGEWRIIDPTASLGATGGRVLQVVRKNLISSGEGRTRIVSPPLPTNKNGLYFLAFSIQESDTALETPVLRYFVLDKSGIPQAIHISEMDVVSPRDNAPLTRDTLFSWKQFEGASAYQVELFNKGDDVAISGKLVHSSTVNLSLSSFSLEQLVSGYEYHWKVRAFNEQGQVMGESEPRTLYLP